MCFNKNNNRKLSWVLIQLNYIDEYPKWVLSQSSLGYLWLCSHGYTFFKMIIHQDPEPRIWPEVFGYLGIYLIEIYLSK